MRGENRLLLFQQTCACVRVDGKLMSVHDKVMNVHDKVARSGTYSTGPTATIPRCSVANSIVGINWLSDFVACRVIDDMTGSLWRRPFAAIVVIEPDSTVHSETSFTGLLGLEGNSAAR